MHPLLFLHFCQEACFAKFNSGNKRTRIISGLAVFHNRYMHKITGITLTVLGKVCTGRYRSGTGPDNNDMTLVYWELSRHWGDPNVMYPPDVFASVYLPVSAEGILVFGIKFGCVLVFSDVSHVHF